MERSKDEDGWWRFLQACSAVRTPEELEEFFSLFLTIEEREALALRYLIVKALVEEKKTQREIAEVLKVSISKITRGSNALKIISSKLRETLNRSP